ncbi:Alpha-mannosidase [uncultured Paludibacter sp.]|nr:Alpha-mannosidase [uncultured Paludibacter sp.]
MKKTVLLLSCIISISVLAQPLQTREPYNIEKDRVLYTVGYAHLDTEWNWDYPETINEYIKNTMLENFHLFEKYPDYVFNFTGSRRYNMMKEYYPELFKKVQFYVKQGRWNVSGSSVDEGEVNISSSESLVRQILYGNQFFRKEFGKESVDYMLPDCFGFLSNLPTVFNHCGLLGFSTQKLTWRSAAGIPFNVGVWNGPDDKGIVAALNATNYTGKVEHRLDTVSKWVKRLDDDKQKTGYAFDYRYYGVGDVGGAPREGDVKNAIGSLRHSDSNFKVILSSSDQMYKDITPEIRKNLPAYKGELLLIEHSAGSMTSQAFMKRINRKNELLAQAAEQVSVGADLFGEKYPSRKINAGWDLVLGSQFHDILPGTSIPKAYEYAWNDEFIAANNFSEVLKDGVKTISSQLNTQTKGKSLVVYNPVAKEREDVVTAELEFEKIPSAIAVYSKENKPLSTQILSTSGNKVKFIFLAKLPSAGFSVFDVREENVASKGNLSITNNSMENEYYRVKVAENGDITSVFDKKLSKELLSAPARLEFQKEHPAQWPAWNMDWKDRQKPPMGFMNEDASVSVVENGPVRVTLQVKRKGFNSEIVQYYSLSAGEAGKRFEVKNRIDWQTLEASLKAAFPFTASNENATYNLGVGTISRGNNTEKHFEVPSKEWFDLTDKSGKFGISVLEDCKYGSDKPNDNTLRLTLLYTPDADCFGDWMMHQKTQDWGIHDVTYAIYSHKGDWAKAETPWQAKFLNQPLLAFESSKHEGDLGQSYSMVSVNNPQVGLMAFKKAEDGDLYVIRVNELSGKDLKNVKVKLPTTIEQAYEVNGQEKKIGAAKITGNELTFDLSHYTIKSFAVKLSSKISENKTEQTVVTLPYNNDEISFDDNRSDVTNGYSIPAELLPDVITSEGIDFKMGNKTDGENNSIVCKGQTVSLPEGNYTKLYLLAYAGGDVSADFIVGDKTSTLNIQNWTGYVGQFYNRILSRDKKKVEEMMEPYSKPANIAWFASHCHNPYPMKNEAYMYCYLYKYELDIPAGAKTITLPKNDKITLFAMTVANPSASNVKELQPLYDTFADRPKFALRNGK